MGKTDGGVTFTLEDEDFRALAHYLVHHAPRGRQLMRRNDIFLLVVLILAALFSAFARDGRLALVMGATCVVLFFWLRRTNRRLIAARVYHAIRPEKGSRPQTPGTLRLNPEGIEGKHGKGSGRVPWQEISVIGRDGGHIFLVIGQTNAFAIPRRAFDSDEEFADFYHLAKQYHAEAGS